MQIYYKSKSSIVIDYDNYTKEISISHFISNMKRDISLGRVIFLQINGEVSSIIVNNKYKYIIPNSNLNADVSENSLISIKQSKELSKILNNLYRFQKNIIDGDNNIINNDNRNNYILCLEYRKRALEKINYNDISKEIGYLKETEVPIPKYNSDSSLTMIFLSYVGIILVCSYLSNNLFIILGSLLYAIPASLFIGTLASMTNWVIASKLEDKRLFYNNIRTCYNNGKQKLKEVKLRLEKIKKQNTNMGIQDSLLKSIYDLTTSLNGINTVRSNEFINELAYLANEYVNLKNSGMKEEQLRRYIVEKEITIELFVNEYIDSYRRSCNLNNTMFNKTKAIKTMQRKIEKK